MALSFKKAVLVTALTTLCLTTFSHGSEDGILEKNYFLQHNDKRVSTSALIHNGEIYVNIHDVTNTLGINSQIDNNQIILSNTSSSIKLQKNQDGNLYSGDLLNGIPHGNGTLFLKNGGKYEGEWVNGSYQGQGSLVMSNGNIYTGSFSNGFIHGEGKMFYPDGSYYKGNYEYGIQEGFGLYYVDPNNKYEGYWENGLRNGKGKAYINGAYKKGLWENNQLIKSLPESSLGF